MAEESVKITLYATVRYGLITYKTIKSNISNTFCMRIVEYESLLVALGSLHLKDT